MDELGSRLSHSDTPNISVHPLYVLDKQASFSIAWPTRDIGVREPVTRDFLPGCQRGQERDARLSVWFPQRRQPDLYAQLNSARQSQLTALGKEHAKKAADSKFDALPPPSRAIVAPGEGAPKLKVFCNIQLVREAFARRPEFTLVTEDTDADVVWLYEQIADFGSLKASVYVAQIPNEECITLKDLLQHTIHKQIGQPSWFLPSCASLTVQLYRGV